MDTYKQLSHTTYQCNYHVVFCSKYRFRILHAVVGRRVRDWVRKIAEWKEVEILESHERYLYSLWDQALKSAQGLGAIVEENSDKLSAEALADIKTELSQDISKRIRDAAEIGDVTVLNAIAEEIKDQSDSCTLLSKQIIQMAEDFDLDGIQKLADDLDAC